MNIKIKNSSYFLNLMNEDFCAKVTFHKEEDLELTNDKLIELKKSIKVAERKYNILFAILSLVLKCNNEELVKRVSLKLENVNKGLASCTHDLEIFESKLAFLLLKDILKIDKVKYFGFSEEYIKNLLTRYKKEAENSYNEYYYNEKTGVLSEITENGFYRPLSYIPTSVADEIKKRETNQNIKRIVR